MSKNQIKLRKLGNQFRKAQILRWNWQVQTGGVIQGTGFRKWAK